MNMPWKVSLNKFKNEMAIQTNLITRYTELLCLLFRYYIEGGKSCLIFGNLVHVALLAVGGSYFFQSTILFRHQAKSSLERVPHKMDWTDRGLTYSHPKKEVSMTAHHQITQRLQRKDKTLLKMRKMRGEFELLDIL